MPLPAGNLRHRVDVLTGTRTPDGQGGATTVWSNFLSREPAHVVPEQGTETWTQGELQANVRYRIRMRYRSTITRKMRISWEGHLLEIEAVLHVGGAYEEMQVVCTEIGT